MLMFVCVCCIIAYLVCMYLLMYLCMYVCTYVPGMYVCLYVCTYISGMYVYTSMYVCMYVYTSMYECTMYFTHVCPYVFMYVCTIQRPIINHFHRQLLRGTIVNRTYGIHKNQYICLLLRTTLGPVHHGPPQYYCSSRGIVRPHICDTSINSFKTAVPWLGTNQSNPE